MQFYSKKFRIKVTDVLAAAERRLKSLTQYTYTICSGDPTPQTVWTCGLNESNVQWSLNQQIQPKPLDVVESVKLRQAVYALTNYYEYQYIRLDMEDLEFFGLV